MADALVADFGGQVACGLNGCCKALYMKFSIIYEALADSTD